LIYDGIDRRQWARVDMHAPLKFREVGEFNRSPLDSETRDISEGGVRFATDRFIPKDSKLVVNIDLNNMPSVKATAKVVWSTRDSHTNMYEVGIEFETINSETRVQLSNIVRKNLN
jgi:c-di-GMP-binding flagellar brake protein YcgR